MKKRYEIIAHALDRRGHVIATASNTYTKTHPLQAYFAQKTGQPEKEFLHAEVAVLLKCKDKPVHTVKIFRYGHDGFFKCAKPCPICQEALAAYGVEHVWYSDNDGILHKL